MIKKRTQHSSVWDMVAESLEDLSQVKDVTTSLREFDQLKYPTPKQYTAQDIRQIRGKLHVSQAVFAHLLNTKLTTVQKWERGVNIPSGPASRLLQIFESKIKKPLLRRSLTVKVQKQMRDKKISLNDLLKDLKSDRRQSRERNSPR